MARNAKRYTQEENEAIFKAVQDSESSLKTCFISVAQQLGRSPQGVANHWYTVLSNPESPHYMGTAMLLLTKHRAGINRTNTTKFPIESKVSWWRRVLTIFKLK